MALLPITVFSLTELGTYQVPFAIINTSLYKFGVDRIETPRIFACPDVDTTIRSYFGVALAVSSVTAAAGVVTVVTSTAHGMTTGSVVVMTGWSIPSGAWTGNGSFVITKVDAVTFTYLAATSSGTATGGTAAPSDSGVSYYFSSPYVFYSQNNTDVFMRCRAFLKRHELKKAFPAYTFTVKRLKGKTGLGAVYYLTSTHPDWPPEVVERVLVKTRAWYKDCLDIHPTWNNIFTGYGAWVQSMVCWHRLGDPDAICTDGLSTGSSYGNTAAGDLKYVTLTNPETTEVDPNDTSPEEMAYSAFNSVQLEMNAHLVTPTPLPAAADDVNYGFGTGPFRSMGDSSPSVMSDGDVNWYVTNGWMFGPVASDSPFAGATIYRLALVDPGGNVKAVFYTVGAVSATLRTTYPDISVSTPIGSFSFTDPTHLASTKKVSSGDLVFPDDVYTVGITRQNTTPQFTAVGTMPVSPAATLIIDPPPGGILVPAGSFTDTGKLFGSNLPANTYASGSLYLSLMLVRSGGVITRCDAWGACGCVNCTCPSSESTIATCSGTMNGSGSVTCSYPSYYIPFGGSSEGCCSCSTYLSVKYDCASVGDCSGCGGMFSGGDCACVGGPTSQFVGIKAGSGCGFFGPGSSSGSYLPGPPGGSYTVCAMYYNYSNSTYSCLPYPTTDPLPPPFAVFTVAAPLTPVGLSVGAYSYPTDLTTSYGGTISFTSMFLAYILSPSSPVSYTAALGDGLVKNSISDTELIPATVYFTGKQARTFPWTFAHLDMTYEALLGTPPDVAPTVPVDAIDSSSSYLTYAAGSSPLGAVVVNLYGYTGVGALAYVNTATAHGLSTGDIVTLAGWTPSYSGSFNGTYSITKSSDTQFTFPNVNNGYYTGTGGTITVVNSSTHYRYAFTKRSVKLTLSSRCSIELSTGTYRYTITPQLISGWVLVPGAGSGAPADITLDLDDGHYVFAVQEMTKPGFWTDEYRCGVVVSATQPVLLPTGADTLTSFFNEPACWKVAGKDGINPDMFIKSTGATAVQVASNGDSGTFFGQVFKTSDSWQARTCPDGAYPVNPIIRHNLFKFDPWAKETALSVLSVIGVAGTVTVVTNTKHNMYTGGTVRTVGWAGGAGTWNGDFVITRVDDLTFTYSASGVGTATGGTAKKIVNKFTVVLTFTGSIGGSNSPILDGSERKGTLYELVGGSWVEQSGSISMKLPPIGYDQLNTSVTYTAKTLAQTFELQTDGSYPTVLSLYPKSVGYLKVQMYEGDIDSIGMLIFEHELNLPNVLGYAYNAWFDLAANSVTSTSFALPTGGSAAGGTFVLVLKEQKGGATPYYDPCFTRAAIIWKASNPAGDTLIDSYKAPAFTHVGTATNTLPMGWSRTSTPGVQFVPTLLASATIDAGSVASFNSALADNPFGSFGPYGTNLRRYIVALSKDTSLKLRYPPSTNFFIGKYCGGTPGNSVACWATPRYTLNVQGPSFWGGRAIYVDRTPVPGAPITLSILTYSPDTTTIYYATADKDGYYWFYAPKASIGSNLRTATTQLDPRGDIWAPRYDLPSAVVVSTVVFGTVDAQVTTVTPHGLEVGDYFYNPSRWYYISGTAETNTWDWAFQVTAKVDNYNIKFSTLGMPCQGKPGTTTAGSQIIPSPWSVVQVFTSYTGWAGLTVALPEFGLGTTEQGKIALMPVSNIDSKMSGSYGNLRTYSLCDEIAEKPSFQSSSLIQTTAAGAGYQLALNTWSGLGSRPLYDNALVYYTLDFLDGFKWNKIQKMREDSGIGAVLTYKPGYVNVYDGSATAQGQFIHYMPGKFALVGYKDYGVKIYDLNDYHAVNEHYDVGFDEMGGIDIVRYCGNNKIAASKRNGARAALMDATNKAKILPLGSINCGPVSDVGLVGDKVFLVGINNNTKLTAFDSSNDMKQVPIRYTLNEQVYTAVLKSASAKVYAGTESKLLQRFEDATLGTEAGKVTLSFVPYKLTEINSGAYIFAGKGSTDEIAIVKTSDMSVVATLAGYGFDVAGTNCYTVAGDTVRCYDISDPVSPVLSWSFNAWDFGSLTPWSFGGREIFYIGGSPEVLLIAAVGPTTTYGLLSCKIDGPGVLSVLDIEKRTDVGSSYNFLHAQFLTDRYLLAPCATDTEFRKIDSFTLNGSSGDLAYVATKTLTTAMYTLPAAARSMSVASGFLFIPQYDVNSLYTYEMIKLTNTFTTTLAFQMQTFLVAACLHVSGGDYYFGTKSIDGLWKVSGAGIPQYGVYNAKTKPGSAIWTNIFVNGNSVAVMGNRVTVFYEYVPAENVLKYRNAIVATPNAYGAGYIDTMSGGVWSGSGLVFYAPIALANTTLGGIAGASVLRSVVRSINTSNLDALAFSPTVVSIADAGTWRPCVGAIATSPDLTRMYIWSQGLYRLFIIDISNTLAPAYVTSGLHGSLSGFNVGSYPLIYDGTILLSILPTASTVGPKPSIGSYILANTSGGVRLEVMGPNSGNRKWTLVPGINAPWLSSTVIDTIAITDITQVGPKYGAKTPITGGTMPNCKLRFYDPYTNTYDEHTTSNQILTTTPIKWVTGPVATKQSFWLKFISETGENLHGVPEKLIYWDPPAGSVTYMTMQLAEGVAKLGVAHDGAQPAFTVDRGYAIRPQGGWGKLTLAVGTFMEVPTQIDLNTFLPNPWMVEYSMPAGTFTMSPIITYARPYSGVNGYDYWDSTSVNTHYRPETYWASQKP